MEVKLKQYCGESKITADNVLQRGKVFKNRKKLLKNKERIMEEFIKESKKIIQRSIYNNKLVLFIGAGVSANSGLPLWKDLIEKIKKKIKVSDNFNDYLKIAQYYYNSRGEKEYYDFLREELEVEVSPNNIHEALLDMNPRHIITTNYDDLIEKEARKKGMFYDVVSKDTDLPYTPNNKMIIKMHGDFKNRNIVFKEDDYLSYSNNFKLIENYIKSLFSTNVVLFVGYSLGDANVQLIFQWIKDILGKDLPKPYFLKIDNIDSEVDINEFEYYKNKGINILYYSQIAKNLHNNLKSETIGDKTYNAVKYLSSREENQFGIEELNQYIEMFKDINILDNKLISNLLENKAKLLKYTDYELKGNTLILRSNKIDNLITDIRKEIKNGKSKVSDFLDKASIFFIVRELKDKKKSRIIYKKRKIKEISYMNIQNDIENYNYKNLNCFINVTGEREVANNIKLEFEKAYAYYIINDYYNSYEEYKKISERSFNSKNMIMYALSEFNRFYIGKMLCNDWMTTATIRKKVKDEIGKINLDKIIYNIPLEIEQLDFIKRILTWSFIQDNLHEMEELRYKIEKDEKIYYMGGIGKDSAGIYLLQKSVKKLWKFIKYNMLSVDRYREVKRIFYNYIDSLLRNYSIPKIQKEYDDFFGMSGENIKIEEISIFDIRVMLEYISLKDLEELLNKYDIENIKIEDEGIGILLNILNNVIDYNLNPYRKNIIDVNKILLLLSKVDVGYENYVNINKQILMFLKGKNLNIENYGYINKYIYYQDEKFRRYDIQTLKDILICVKKEIITMNMENINNNQEYIINNIAHIIHKNDKKFKLDLEVEELLYKGKSGIIIDKILMDLYYICNQEDKKKIRDVIRLKLETKEFSMIESKIYYEAIMRKIIVSNKKYEEKIQEYLDKEIKEKENSKLRTYPDPVEVLLSNIINLILNNDIKDKGRFEKYIGIKDDYDFLFNLDNYENEKININWLNTFSNKLLERLAENKKIKCEIGRQIKQELLSNNNFDKKLLRIYLEYFS